MAVVCRSVQVNTFKSHCSDACQNCFAHFPMVCGEKALDLNLAAKFNNPYHKYRH